MSQDNFFSHKQSQDNFFSHKQEEKKLSQDEINAYKILGVNPNDSYEIVKRAYQRLKKVYSVERSYKKNSKKQFGPEKDDFNKFSALNDVIWAWNVIKKARNIDDSERHTVHTKKEADYKYCLLTLFAQVMKADGENMVCELDKVKEAIRRHFKTEIKQKEALQQFKDILNSKQDLRDIYNTVNKCLSHVAKSEVIMELLAIAYSDDLFSVKEEALIKEIAKNLNYNEEKYKSIYTIFKNKYENGYYKENKKSNESKKNDNKKSKKSKRQNDRNSSQESNRSNDSSNNTNTQPKKRFTIDEAYDILEVAGSTSDAEIKKAYRALAVKYHPDKFETLGDEAVRQATETMKQINMAWGLVKNARGIK